MSFKNATQLFKAFHGREPVTGELMKVEARHSFNCLAVGSLDGLIYTALSDGKKYVHQFKKSARPVLLVSDDGKQIFVLAGGYRFTARGFEDRSHRRRKK